MTAKEFYVVALRILAIWFVCEGLIVMLSMATGPFATLIVGIGLLIFARIRGVLT
jgi:hypothetical protein